MSPVEHAAKRLLAGQEMVASKAPGLKSLLSIPLHKTLQAVARRGIHTLKGLLDAKKHLTAAVSELRPHHLC